LLLNQDKVATMFGVIFWKGKSERIQIAQNKDGSVWTGNTVTEADEKATELENQFGVECRTISFQGVEE